MHADSIEKKLHFFEGEIKNFEAIAEQIKPQSGEFPELKGIDIYGEAMPYNGVVGGDHIIYVDFNKRYDLDSRIKGALDAGLPKVAENLKLNKRRAGILLADVAGHKITDAMLAAMLHQAFLTGVLYELKQFGEVTLELFENLNTRFYKSSSVTKFITMVYGEIHEDGKFRFVNAGHPPPLVFSYKFDRLVDISLVRMVHVQPIGTLPSREDIDASRNFSRLGYKQNYTTQEINLMGAGDILLLYSDGFSEHNRNMESFYFCEKLEDTLRKAKGLPAREIFATLKEDMLKFAEPGDDISIVVIKKIS